MGLDFCSEETQMDDETVSGILHKGVQVSHAAIMLTHFCIFEGTVLPREQL